LLEEILGNEDYNEKKPIARSVDQNAVHMALNENVGKQQRIPISCIIILQNSHLTFS
jgi:hypothetical protein